MTTLVLDFETTMPGVDIKTHGLDNYIAKAEPLCVAWAIDDGPALVLDLTHRISVFGLPSGHTASRRRARGVPSARFGLDRCLLTDAIRDSRITKIAQNISFERAILRKLGLDTPITEWVDTSVLARYVGLPSKLADICKALRLGEMGKHEDGTRLINKFCKPRKDGSFRDKISDPEDWQKFLDYCRGDVIAEREVFKRLKKFMLPDRERRLWELDDKINRRGLPVDMQYVTQASRQAAAEKQKLMAELRAITGLENPNSRNQFLGWAKSHGYSYSSLGKDFIARFEKMLEEDSNECAA